MKATIVLQAGDDEQYAPDAFDTSIGKRVPLTVLDAPSGEVTILSAQVSADGTSVELTFLSDDDAGVLNGLGTALYVNTVNRSRRRRWLTIAKKVFGRRHSPPRS